MNKRIGWWSQYSLAPNLKKKAMSFKDKCKFIKKECLAPEEKHTFFPGNEILRNRVKGFSKFLLRPNSVLMTLWDLLILLISIWICLIVPYSISYCEDIPVLYYYIFSSIFTLDIIVRFNSAYFLCGNELTDRTEIAKHYMKSWFLIDLISAIPTETLIPMGYEYDSPKPIDSKENSRLVLLLKLLKILRFTNITNKMLDMSIGSSVHLITIVFSHLLAIILPIHWIGCVLNYLYTYNLENSYEYWTAPVIGKYHQYLVFIEKVVQTITSVGYGDSISKFYNERIAIIVIMTLTSGFLGFFVGRIELIVIKSSQNEIFFRNIRSRLLSYCNKNNVPKNLKNKIMNYIRHLRCTYNANSIQDEDIINLLSVPLREQVFLYTKGYVLMEISFLGDLSGPCIRSLGYKMFLQVFGPFDIIFTQGEVMPILYFINLGSIQICHQQSKSIFIELQKHDIFGEICFLTNEGRTASAISSSFSEMLCLSRYDLDKILETMPKDKEKFYTVCRNIKNYGISFIGIQCYLCGSTSHLAKNCPSFILKPDIDKTKSTIKRTKIKIESSALNIRKDRNSNLRFGLHNTKGIKTDPQKIYKSDLHLAKKCDKHIYLVQLNENQVNSYAFKRNLLISEDSSQYSSESEKDLADFNCSNVGDIGDIDDIGDIESIEDIELPEYHSCNDQFHLKIPSL